MGAGRAEMTTLLVNRQVVAVAVLVVLE